MSTYLEALRRIGPVDKDLLPHERAKEEKARKQEESNAFVQRFAQVEDDFWEGAEVRITDPETGGMKNSKPCQLGWAPPMALRELGYVYEFGARKYTPTNYRAGYDWSLSVNSLYRHVLDFLEGRSYDLNEDGEIDENNSGHHHLAHAAWHCLTLMYYDMCEKGTDDITWSDDVSKDRNNSGNNSRGDSEA